MNPTVYSEQNKNEIKIQLTITIANIITRRSMHHALTHTHTHTPMHTVYEYAKYMHFNYKLIHSHMQSVSLPKGNYCFRMTVFREQKPFLICHIAPTHAHIHTALASSFPFRVRIPDCQRAFVVWGTRIVYMWVNCL